MELSMGDAARPEVDVHVFGLTMIATKSMDFGNGNTRWRLAREGRTEDGQNSSFDLNETTSLKRVSSASSHSAGASGLSCQMSQALGSQQRSYVDGSTRL